jgi:hypothetical protein
MFWFYKIQCKGKILRMCVGSVSQKLSSVDLYQYNYFSCLAHDDKREISLYQTARLIFYLFLLSNYFRSYYTLTCVLVALHRPYSAYKHSLYSLLSPTVYMGSINFDFDIQQPTLCDKLNIPTCVLCYRLRKDHIPSNYFLISESNFCFLRAPLSLLYKSSYKLTRFLDGNSSDFPKTRCECFCVIRYIDWREISDKVKAINAIFPWPLPINSWSTMLVLYQDKRTLHNKIAVFQYEIVFCVHTTKLRL